MSGMQQKPNSNAIWGLTFVFEYFLTPATDMWQESCTSEFEVTSSLLVFLCLGYYMVCNIIGGLNGDRLLFYKSWKLS